MTQEEKDLVLRDLCARLPYNVWVSYKTKYDDIERATILNGNYVRDIMEGISSWIDFKPYLRPMSSMTEEEKFELKQEHVKDQQLFAEVIVVLNNTEMRGKVIPHFAADWCDKNMFDYRGLIDKGRAIKVTEDNNPYKD